MNKITLYILCGLLIFCRCNNRQPDPPSNSNNSIRDSVPDDVTAKKIALQYWISEYGELVSADTPFICQLKNDSIWSVEGTLNENRKGGVPFILINKRDGKIFVVGHGK